LRHVDIHGENNMGLEGEGLVTKSKTSATHYVTIPSWIARDSQFPFKAGEKVKVTVLPDEGKIIITKKRER